MNSQPSARLTNSLNYNFSRFGRESGEEVYHVHIVLSPGTVVHAGYGMLMQSADARPYAVTARAFFFKASYLVRP